MRSLILRIYVQVRIINGVVSVLLRHTVYCCRIVQGGAIAEWLANLACWTNDREIGVPVPLAASGRVATVGQLLFAPYGPGFTQPSFLSGSVNEYRLRLERYIRQVCATLLGARHVPERFCGGACLQRGAITSVRPLPLPLHSINEIRL